MGSTTVDAIWRKLKQQECKDARLESLWKHVQAGTCSSSNNSSKQLTQSSSSMQASVQQSSSLARRDALRCSLKDGPAVSQLALALQSRDGSTVKAALCQLQDALSDTSAAASLSLPTSKLCKALLRCFDNRTEACRDKAVACCSMLLQADPDAVLSLLPYVMPVLVERLQCDESHNPTEPSEEVRLQLVQLLSLIMDQAGSAIAAYASEVWSMLTALLVDTFHEVAVQGCWVSQQLAAILGMRLGATSKELVAALLPLTTHKQYRVRVAAVEAIQDVMHQGAHEMVLEMVAWRDPNLVPIKAFYGDDLKINYCGKLATDTHVQVRLAFLDCIGNWMLTLRERRDHEARLLPYILSGICDESPAVVQAALQFLDKLGQQYEQEHEAELADMLRFADRLEWGAEAQLMQAGGLRYAASWDALQQQERLSVEGAGASALGFAAQRQEAGQVSLTQAAAAAGQDQAPRTPTAASVGAGQGAAHSFTLPGPFQQRARLGSRLLVRGNFSSLLPALCRELSSWQSCPRAMSARLLLVSLLLVESAAEQHLQAILPALCAAVLDGEAGAAVCACAAVLGCFCPLERLLDLLTPRMEDWAGEPRRQAGGLTLLTAFMRGASALQPLNSHQPRLLRLLLELGVADSHDSSIRAAMLQLVEQLLAPQPPTVTTVGHQATCNTSTGSRDADAAAACSLLEQVLRSMLASSSNGSDVCLDSLGSGFGVDATQEQERLAAALQRVLAAE